MFPHDAERIKEEDDCVVFAMFDVEYSLFKAFFRTHPSERLQDLLAEKEFERTCGGDLSPVRVFVTRTAASESTSRMFGTRPVLSSSFFR